MRKHDNRFPVTVSGVSVDVYDDNINKALRQFNRKAQDAGVVRECKDSMYYEKPSAVKQRKEKAARKRWLKKLSKSQPTKR